MLWRYLESIRPLQIVPGPQETPLPLSIDLIKTHLSLDGSAFDAILPLWQRAAITWAEDAMRRSIMARTHTYVISGFPYRPFGYRYSYYHTNDHREIILPRGKCQRVEKIEFYRNNELQVMYGPTSPDVGSPGGADYAESLLSDAGGIIMPPHNQSWSQDIDYDVPQPVTITYRAGWENIDEVPADIVHALLFTMTDFLEMRGGMDLKELGSLAASGRTFDVRENLIGAYVLRRIF